MSWDGLTSGWGADVDATDKLIETMQAAAHEEWESRIAEIQQWADEATDPWYRKRHQEHADRLRAMPVPWGQASAVA
jgi:hypothetical protein